MTVALVDAPARPIVAAPAVANIPDELQGLPQWILWRYQWNGKRWTKVPCRPSNGLASSTDPGSWDRLDRVMAVYQRGGFDGIGFVFTAADPFVGTDLDHCFTESGDLTALAREVVADLATYTERSPSGTGLHLVCRGKLPGAGRNNRELGIEMYDRARYFTMTGDRFAGGRDLVEDRPGAVARLYQRISGASEPPAAPTDRNHSTPPQMSAADVIRRARAAANGDKFAALFDRGDIRAYESDSEADLALCCILAFWTRDPGQIARVMQMGALGQREKWQKRPDYQQRTIDRALEVVRDHYDPERAQRDRPTEAARGAKEAGSAPAAPGLVCLADVQPEALTWLWPGRVPLGKLTILDGDPGLGKSMITLDLAARVSRGWAMPDVSWGDLHEPGAVIVMSAEDGLADTIRPRLDAAGADTQRIVALTHIAEESGERLPTLGDLAQIEAAIIISKARLVIVDPLMAYLPETTNSNRDADIRRLLAPLAALAERTSASVLVVRHLNKAANANALYRGGGSIAIIGAARSGLLVAPDPDDPDRNRRILAVSKSNLAAPPPALAYRVEPADPGTARIVWEGATEHTAATLLALPADPESRASLNAAQKFLRDLLADGPRAKQEVDHAAQQAGISRATLNRAKAALGIHPQKSGFDGGWQWTLPAKMIKNGEGDQPQGDDHLRQVDHLRSGPAGGELPPELRRMERAAAILDGED